MDWKYILKRVIVGVTIFLIIYFLKAYILLDVHAQEISSYDTGGTSGFVNSTDTGFSLNVTTNPWANWGSGYLYFNFSLSKYSGSSTSTIVTPRSAYATSGNTTYVCSIGTATNNNSTWNTLVYSAKCPMNMGSDGLTLIYVRLFDNQAGQEIGSYEYSIAGLMTFEQVSNVDVNVDTSGTTTAINNQITNDNSNTQSIINNQNSNTEQQIESQKVCTVLNSSFIKESSKVLNQAGNVIDGSAAFGVSDYINISNSELTLITQYDYWIANCFYDENKTLISCVRNNDISEGVISVPTGTVYARFTFNKTLDKPIFKYCKNGNQAIADGQQQINDSLTDDSINADTGDDFFENFNFGDDTLSAVITAPLSFLNSLTSSQCSPYTFTLFNQEVSIPCGSIVWGRNDFSDFKSWWNLFFGGIAIYTLGLKLFKVVHDAIDPSKDNIESVGVA